jgi:hypothetical protein
MENLTKPHKEAGGFFEVLYTKVSSIAKEESAECLDTVMPTLLETTIHTRPSTKG